MPRRFHDLATHGALLALLVCLPSVAQAQGGNGLEFINQGAKGAGRGGASTALADDSQSVARNPALLTRLGGTRADGTLVFNLERVRRRNDTDNVLEENLSVWPLPVLSFSTDLTDADRLDEADFSDTGPYVGFGFFQPVQGVVSPTLTVALDLSETVSFGISLNVLLLYGQFESRPPSKGGGGGTDDDFRPEGKVFVHYQPDGTPIVPPQPFDPGTGTQLTWGDIFEIADSGATGGPSNGKEITPIQFKVDSLFGAGIMGQIGFLWTPRDDVSVGLSLRTPGIIFKPTGSGEIDLTESVSDLENDPDLGLVIGSLLDSYLPNRRANGLKGEYDLSTDNVILPASVSLGVAWWPLPTWVITADLRWIGWSHSVTKIEITGTGGENEDLNEIAGGTSLTYTYNLEWDDQIVFAIGTTLGVNEWFLLRAGYNYGNNPVPPHTASATALVVEHHLSLGCGIRLGDWDIDFAYIYGLPKQVDRSRSSFRVENHQVQLGVGYQF